MNQTKIVIIVLVVLVIVFVVGIAGGAFGGNSNTVNIASLKDGFFGTLNRLLTSSQHLMADDIQVFPSAFCSLQRVDQVNGIAVTPVVTLVVAPGNTCVFTILEHKGVSVRGVRLTPSPGTRVDLTLDPRGAMKGTLTLPTPTPNPTPYSNRNLDVYEQGGTLTVRCNAGDATGRCRLKLD